MNREVAMLQEIAQNRLEKWVECSKSLKRATFLWFLFLVIAFVEFLWIIKPNF